jgi:hypothetical protein
MPYELEQWKRNYVFWVKDMPIQHHSGLNLFLFSTNLI